MVESRRGSVVPAGIGKFPFVFEIVAKRLVKVVK